MMRGIRRLIVYSAVTGLVVAGAVTATIGVAHANFVNQCSVTASPYNCSITGSIPSPSAITVTVNDQVANASEEVTVSWAANGISCTNGSGTQSAPTGAETGPATVNDPLFVTLPLPATAVDGVCNVTVNMSVTQSNPTAFTAFLDYTPSASPTATATATATPTPTSTSTSAGPPVHPIKGYGGKCVDDRQNSSANRSEIIIWTCSGTDQAQNWKFSNGEFIHNGKCMNDQYNGGNRSKVILYTCNGASNEKWSELANGELMLKSHGGTLCLDDPHYSTANRTQLIVYTCKDSANQKWSLP